MNRSVYIYLSFISVFFLLSPLVCLMVFYLIFIKESTLPKKDDMYVLLLGCLLCSVFVSAINVTKIPENDLEWYLYSYEQAKYYPIWQFALIGSNPYLEESGKEPLYGILVWLLNRTLGGNTMWFKFVYSLINYSLLTYAVVAFGKKLKFPSWLMLAGIFMMCFIPYIFTMSLQLLRQFLAGSIFIFVLIRVCFYQKKDYALMLAMGLIHSTAWFFIPLLLFPAFERHFKKARIWYVGAFLGIIGIRFLANTVLVLGIFGGSSTMTYALQRASVETAFVLEELSFVKIAMIVCILIYSVYLSYASPYKHVAGMKRFGFVLTLLSVFILINMNQVELANRFFFYTFPAVPFLLMFLFREMKFSRVTVSLAVLSVITFFVFYLKAGSWEYNIYDSVWITPIIYYFIA